MSRDYDVILGVGREASPKQIQTAFRHNAKRLHPDVCADAEGFREINEAYRTLSDADKRRSYDTALGMQDGPPISRREVARREMQRARFGPSPVVPPGTGPLLAGFQTFDLGLQISPALARFGGDLLINLPMTIACPRCRGDFRWLMPCGLCFGRGTVDTCLSLPLTVLAGTADGDRRTVLLEGERLMLNITFICRS